MKAANKVKRNTLTAEDWEQEALNLIACKGVASLGVEPLARQMGITKGSFYWHFANREALLTQALKRWEEHDARNLTTALGAISDARERLRSFFRASAREVFTAEIYTALLLAVDDPLVSPVLERVAERRLQHIKAAFMELGVSETDAMHRATLSYSAYVGFLQLQRQKQALELEDDAFLAYVEHVIDTLIPVS